MLTSRAATRARPVVDVEGRVQLGDVSMQQLAAGHHLAADGTDHRQRNAVCGRGADSGSHCCRQHVKVYGQVQDVDPAEEIRHKGLRGPGGAVLIQQILHPQLRGGAEQRPCVVGFGNSDDAVLQFAPRGHLRAGHLEERGPRAGGGLIPEVEVGIKVEDAKPLAVADRPGPCHAEVARVRGFVAAAQQQGEVAAVEQCGHGEACAGLAGLQFAVADHHVAGVGDCPLRVVGEGAQRTADGRRGGRGSGPALVPAHALIAAEAEDHGRASGGDGSVRGGGVFRSRCHGLPPPAVRLAVAVVAARPGAGLNVNGERGKVHASSSPHGHSESQRRRRRDV
jgi:hypothetical protein